MDGLDVCRHCWSCGDPCHGKPHLRGRGGVDFSVSHTTDVVVAVVSDQVRVGIDIEAASRHLDRGMARLTLTNAELSDWDECEPTNRADYLLARWTAKEAAAKASGLGLALEFASFPVEEFAGRQLVTVAGVRWEVEFLRGPDGFVTALATSRQRQLGESTFDCT